MSEKKFEQCTLAEATNIEVNGKVYLLENDKIALEYYHDKCIGIRWWDTDTFIPEELFSTLGIKPLREAKREPIKFHHTFGNHYAAPLAAQGKTFLCVELIDEECPQILEGEE